MMSDHDSVFRKSKCRACFDGLDPFALRFDLYCTTAHHLHEPETGSVRCVGQPGQDHLRVSMNFVETTGRCCIKFFFGLMQRDVFLTRYAKFCPREYLQAAWRNGFFATCADAVFALAEPVQRG